MAKSRIELEFHGTSRGFKDVNTDVKSFGKSMRDAGNAGKQIFGELETVIGGKLNGALSTSFGLFNEIAKGGIWGIMAKGVELVANWIVKWRDAMKEAEEFARRSLLATLNRMSEAYNKLAKNYDKYIASVKEGTKNEKEWTSIQDERKLTQLNIKTIDAKRGKSSEQQAVIQAEAEREATAIRNKTAAINAQRDVEEKAKIAEALRQKAEAAQEAAWKTPTGAADPKLRDAAKTYELHENGYMSDAGFDKWKEEHKEIADEYEKLRDSTEKMREEAEAAQKAYKDAIGDLVEAKEKAANQELKNIEAQKSADFAVEEAKKKLADAEAAAAKKKADEEAAAAEKKKAAEEKILKEREAAAKKVQEAEEKLAETMNQAALENEKMMQDILAKKKGEVEKAGNEVDAAKTKVLDAVRNYRDRSAIKAQMREEHENEVATRKLERDFDTLQKRREDWRDAKNLSARQRAVRDWALAKEKEKAAEQQQARARLAVINMERLLRDAVTI